MTVTTERITSATVFPVGVEARLAYVKALPPEEQFFYWVRERHNVYLRRAAGLPTPWTDDPILQSQKFTNVYRELDKTTVWFREHVREPLRDDPRVVFATLAFRWFNYIRTGEVLLANGWLTEWDEAAAVAELSRRRAAGETIFTSAYIINARAGELKVENICSRISNVWRRRKHLALLARSWCRLAEAHHDLLRYDGLGPFMAYEAVCDLRHTFALANASDTLTWSNPGPGATRGLMRVLGREIKDKRNDRKPPTPHDWEPQTRRLLAELNRRFPDMPPFEMREAEGSLCEVDKWMRVLHGDGHSKRRYPGGAAAVPHDVAA